MLGFARLFAIVCGLLLIGFGAWLATYGNEGEPILAVTGLLTAFFGAIMIGVLAFERMRYHSGAAEPPAPAASPGGETAGEPLEPRFRPTPEVFVDPTSGTTMRVLIDPATGERRYRVEA
jgi:cytochrome c biogenesis protein CcdA